jgi:hypothetical protein
MSNFPETGITYEQLADNLKPILDVHLRLAGGIEMWCNIRSFLIDQMHQKKSSLIRKRYKITDPITNLYYSKYLFEGKRKISSLDIFPCSYKSVLEDVIAAQMPWEFRVTSIYYNHMNKPDRFRYSDFDESEWSLSIGDTMSPNDIEVMQRYKTGLVQFLDLCLNVVLQSPRSKSDHGRLKRYRDKINNLIHYT